MTQPVLSRTLFVANLALYEIGWFATVLGAAAHHPWLGPALTVPIVAWHIYSAQSAWREGALIVAVTVLGGTLDALLTARGWLVFPEAGVLPGIQPWWMLALWTQLATTLNVSLRWLRARPRLAAAFAAVGAPLAYAGGARLGAVSIAAPVPAFVALALGWPLVLLVALSLARTLDGYRAHGRTAAVGAPA